MRLLNKVTLATLFSTLLWAFNIDLDSIFNHCHDLSFSPMTMASVSASITKTRSQIGSLVDFANKRVTRADCLSLRAGRWKKGGPPYVLTFTMCSFDQGVFEAIIQRTMPAELTLQDCDFEGVELRTNGAGQTIKKLDVRGRTVTDERLSLLSSCPSLTSLNLADTDINGNCLSRVPQLEKLADLNLRNTQFANEYVPLLSRCEVMQHLDIEGTHCSPSEFMKAGLLPNLRTLRVSYWECPDEWFAVFAQHPRMACGGQEKTLNFSCCALTDKAIHNLKANLKCSSVNLSNTYISDESGELLKFMPLATSVNLAVGRQV
jgi:hypothetical protein